MLETNVFQAILVLYWYEEDYVFEFIKLLLYVLGSAGMIYASYHDFRHAQNGQKGQMHLLSKQKDQRICPCMFQLFILIKSYRALLSIGLFLFFLQPEKERKSRTDQEGAE